MATHDVGDHKTLRLLLVQKERAQACSVGMTKAARQNCGVTVKDFANASFSPEMIEILNSAMEAAIEALPDPVHSSTVQAIAESILRNAQAGETNAVALQRLALLELQISPRH